MLYGKEFDIDDFEKLYVITLAEENSFAEIGNGKFNENDFDKICNLAKYKLEHQEQFYGDDKNIKADDVNYYMIPRKVKQIVRYDNQEREIEKEAYLIIDSAGNSLCLLVDDVQIPTSDFIVKANEGLEKTPREVSKAEEKLEKEMQDIGISVDVIDMLAQRYGCRKDQISLRKIENLEKIQEDIGINLKSERGKVIAIRIDYGFQKRYYLINSETGERYRTYREDNGSIEEVKDYFRYPKRKGEDSKPLRKDEKRSYITYLDVNGNIKEMKYINNGKNNDMLKEERERYIAEVSEADNVLKNTIDEYQKDNTQENWLRVKSAMKARILVDKKYNVLENQRKVTEGTLEEAKDETLRKVGKPKDRELQDDDWYTGYFHRDPRWNF